MVHDPNFDVLESILRLNAEKANPTAAESICDVIGGYPEFDLLPYLQQLCHLMVLYDIPPLTGMMMAKCSQSIHFALRVLFLMQSAVEDDVPELVHRANSLWKKCELAAINSTDTAPSLSRIRLHAQGLRIENLKGVGNGATPSHEVIPANPLAMSTGGVVGKREYEYFYSELHLVNSLYSVSAALMTISLESTRLKELRDRALKLLLQQVNVQLIQGANMELPIYPGCIIVNIYHPDSVCLSSRNRVPYLMIMEVLDNSEPRLHPKQTASLPPDDTDHNSRRLTVHGPSFEVIDEEGDDWVLLHNDKRKRQDNPLIEGFKEFWTDKQKRIQATSQYGHLPNWKLMGVIVKHGDDLRQEQLASQLIGMVHAWIEAERLPLWLRPYTVLATSSTAGLIEYIPDSASIDSLKKRLNGRSLSEYYIYVYGHRTHKKFVAALRNFVESCAAYSLVCYLLQLKDRHNGNILVDLEGHIIHIDFGFMMTLSPGNIGFESAPFKLTAEFIDLMGGVDSNMFKYFKTLLHSGFLLVRRHADELCSLVEMMEVNSRLPCFARSRGLAATAALRSRLRLDLSDDGCIAFVDSLVHGAMRSWTTGSYDSYQYYTNGIL